MDIRQGDCLEVMRGMDAESVDAIVTDPPYGLKFMGKAWDHGVPGVEYWFEALRVLKPGGHLAAFGGTRTFHRLACAIEDAGFEVRDCLSWLYGQGFPKSLDVSKAIDKQAGIWRGRCGAVTIPEQSAKGREYERGEKGEPATHDAQAWQGWGTALKPAWEPIILARKPLAGTVAANVLEHGTGALNVDGCRIGTTVETWPTSRSYAPGQLQPGGRGKTEQTGAVPPVRWPANVVLDESAAAMLDAQSGEQKDGIAGARTGKNGLFGGLNGYEADWGTYGGSGGASRFFYTAKASTAERQGAATDRNRHPTVKPLDLMRWLCRLVTPPGGLVLDPFVGSGTTVHAALLEGFRAIGIERDEEMAAFARTRVAGQLFAGSRTSEA